MWYLSGECRMEPMLNSKCLLIARNTFNLLRLRKFWKCDYDCLPPLETGERSQWHCTCLPKLTSICIFICWFLPVWSCIHLQAETDWKWYPFVEPLFFFSPHLPPYPSIARLSLTMPDLVQSSKSLEKVIFPVRTLQASFNFSFLPFLFRSHIPFQVELLTNAQSQNTLFFNYLSHSMCPFC